MPIYQFVDKRGRPCDHYFDYDDAPSIGDWVKVGRKLVRRVPSHHSGVVVESNFHIRGYSVDPTHPALEKAGIKKDKEGFAVFDGKRDIERFKNESERMHEKDESVERVGFSNDRPRIGEE